LSQKDEAWAACQEGRQVCPDDPEIFFEEARMLLDQGKLDVAEQSYLQLVGKGGNTGFSQASTRRCTATYRGRIWASSISAWGDWRMPSDNGGWCSKNGLGFSWRKRPLCGSAPRP